MASHTDYINNTNAPKEEYCLDSQKHLSIDQSTKSIILNSDICEQHNNICSQESNEAESSKSDDWETILDDKNENDICSTMDQKLFTETLRGVGLQNQPDTQKNQQFNKRNKLNIKNVQKNSEQERTSDYIEIDDVCADDITKISDLELLEKSTAISKNLKFQFNKRFEENKNKYISWMTKSLEWIKNVMCELATRNGQTIQQNNTIKKTDTISRNSYMFCEFGSTCRFNYNKDQKCYGQHYVYNLVYFDVLDTLKYIALIDLIDLNNQVLEKVSEENKYAQEIKTSINTITYVINHMYDELSHVKDINPKIYKEYEKKTIKFKSTVNTNCKSRKTNGRD
jgi:hypothetical protein